MMEKVKKVGIRREKGYIYFVDKEGDISRTKTSPRKKTKGKSFKKTAEKHLSQVLGELHATKRESYIMQNNLKELLR